MSNQIAIAYGGNGILDDVVGPKVREYRVQAAGSKHINCSWDGSGSRTHYRAFNAQGIEIRLPEHAGAVQFGGNSADVQIDGNPIAYLVSFSVFRGKHMQPTVYLPVAEFERIKAQNTGNSQLTAVELYALAVTAQLKSSARRDEFVSWARRNEVTAEFDDVRADLVEMQLLRKNNAITPAGRNAASGVKIGPYA